MEKATAISSMLLSTVNYPLFNAVRHHIRAYMDIPDFCIETYEKAEFVKKYGLTMYLPRDNANLCPKKLIRCLMYKYPELYTKDIKIFCRSTFTSDPPAKRSRIGDRILLFDSPALAEKLRPFPEDKKFYLNHDLQNCQSFNKTENYYKLISTCNDSSQIVEQVAPCQARPVYQLTKSKQQSNKQGKKLIQKVRQSRNHRKTHRNVWLKVVTSRYTPLYQAKQDIYKFMVLPATETVWARPEMGRAG